MDYDLSRGSTNTPVASCYRNQDSVGHWPSADLYPENSVHSLIHVAAIIHIVQT